jgi:hypothetical protein
MQNLDKPRPSGRTGTDWWSTRFGDRGLLQLIIGTDALFVVPVIFSVAMAYAAVIKEHYDLLGILMKFLFFVVGLYFFKDFVNIIRRWRS